MLLALPACEPADLRPDPPRTVLLDEHADEAVEILRVTIGGDPRAAVVTWTMGGDIRRNAGEASGVQAHMIGDSVNVHAVVRFLVGGKRLRGSVITVPPTAGAMGLDAPLKMTRDGRSFSLRLPLGVSAKLQGRFRWGSWVDAARGGDPLHILPPEGDQSVEPVVKESRSG